MQKPDPLIRTKLHQPFIRPGLVLRSRLQEQIAHGLCGPLTIITAPAGFGKTTLVASCIAESRLRAAWLSLDASDNQPGQFLTYLVAAIQAADPRLGSEAAQWVTGIQKARPEAVLTSLINDLDSVGVEMALVLDDYHLITSPAVHEALAFFIEHLPGCFHLVIATRSDPPLPLARLRARGQMVEIRASELRFTEQEAAQFLNDGMGLRLDARSIAVLLTRTEGWIAGLQMAALSMKGRKDIGGFIQGFSGTNRYILDYLIEEVLARQPAEVQQFLLITSILERLSAPLCDALLAEAPHSSPRASAEILASLERENVFLVALEDEDASGQGAAWFRYHHLFADLLRARLLQAQPERIPALHIRASQWLEANGLIAEAIQHLIAAQASDRAADMVEHYGPIYWSENNPSIIQQAADLPRELLLARPKLGLYLAWLLICQAHVESAIPMLMDLAQRLTQDEANAELHWVQTVIQCARAFLSFAANLPAAQDLEEIPAEEPILRDAADVLYGMALARRGDLDGSVKIAQRCIQTFSERIKTEAIWAIPSPVPFLARIYFVMGRLHDAAALCLEYLERAQQQSCSYINSPGSMDTVLGEVLYEWNQLEEAEQLIRRGLQANKPWENIMTEGFGVISLAYVLQTKGDFAGALQILQEFESRTQRTARPREFEEELRTLGLRIQLATGDLQSAARWAEQIRQSEDFSLHPWRYRFTLASIYVAQERYIEATELLESDLNLETLINLVARQIQVQVLLAVAAARQQRLPEAYEHIHAALSLAEPEGYLRTFLNFGAPVQDLLAAYLRSGSGGHALYARKILEAFPPSPAAGSPVHAADAQAAAPTEALVEPLTNREIEVLQLMAQGKTNPEIARLLVLSPGTIKAHAASIYRKLDTANRTEAVMRARQLGILP